MGSDSGRMLCVNRVHRLCLRLQPMCTSASSYYSKEEAASFALPSKLEIPMLATLLVSVAGCPKTTRQLVQPVGDLDEPRVCGEDAFLVKAPANSERLFLAVLDGVGGWAQHPGVDAGRVSHELMTNMAQLLGSHHSVSSPLALLDGAFEQTKEAALSDPHIIGSTTACVAMLGRPSDLASGVVQLDVVNVGDSGLFVLRSGSLAFQSTPTHADADAEFPVVPLQLAVVPAELKGQGYVESIPSEGSVSQCQLKEGDWVILASDGVIDNVRVESLGQALDNVDPNSPVASALVAAALKGPKVDDITAIAMYVSRIEPTPTSK